MKPTQEQILQWAREAGFEDYEWTSLSGHSDLDETLQVGEYPIGESVFLLATLAYEAGRKDENEACIKTLEDFSQTRMVPVKDTWRMGLIVGAHALRRRGENND